MAFCSKFALLTFVAASVVSIDVPVRHFLSFHSQAVFAAEPGVGMLTVHVVDEAGRPLPARVHLRDADGRDLFLPGQATRQSAVYKGTQPVCGDWFYTDGSFRIEVGAGEAQIDIAHGPAYATVHDAISIVTGQTIAKTYTLRRLIDPLAMGWYSADEHLHQMPDAALMLAEDLNLAAVPICGGVELSYRPRQKVTPLPDANHLLVTQLPAIEWDCFLWSLPQRLELRLGDEPWPQEDFATSDRPGGSADLRTSFVVRTPFLVEQAHAAGATTIAYMHDPPRLWYYPLYVANGWIDVYGALENSYCSIANRGTEADFWQSLDRDGTNGNFGVWYRFLNCGYRLPASAGTDNVGMGVGVWKGYNRVYAKLDGPLTVENWLSALKRGRTFVTNRPLLFVTVDGQEPGSELHLKKATPLSVDIHAVSATPIARIDIVYQGRILKQIDVDPATDIRRSEKITVPGSGWLAVRCLGRGGNPNLSPAFAFAHTSPFYVLADGRPIRSPEDARYFHDYFSAFMKRSLPRVRNEQIRRVLDAKCRDALAKYAAQAELQEAEAEPASGIQHPKVN
jgi:TolB protein